MLFTPRFLSPFGDDSTLFDPADFDTVRGGMREHPLSLAPPRPLMGRGREGLGWSKKRKAPNRLGQRAPKCRRLGVSLALPIVAQSFEKVNHFRGLTKMIPHGSRAPLINTDRASGPLSRVARMGHLRSP